jgi:DNA-binding transcriptional ArsR family regulator
VVLDSDVRRDILILLARGASPAGTIAETLDKSRSGVSQHLSHLLSADLVTCEHRGAQRIYALNVPRALAAWDEWVEGAR